jgi:short-subunit dehydrogenase
MDLILVARSLGRLEALAHRIQRQTGRMPELIGVGRHAMSSNLRNAEVADRYRVPAKGAGPQPRSTS